MSKQDVEHLDYVENSKENESNDDSESWSRKKMEKQLVWKQDLRIIPVCVGIYLLCYLDRSNIGNARTLNANTKHDLLSTLGMTQHQFLISLMTFLVAYAVFEAPSNILLKKTSPSAWIGFLMLGWGTMTIAMGASRNFATIATLRFFLGVFEAGLFPGLVFYVTFWYKREERSTRIAIFFASATLAGAFGGALAYGIGHMNQVGGLPGWRWLFYLEGIPSIVCAVLVFFFMPNYPSTAKWLSAEEKELARERIEGELAARSEDDSTWKLLMTTLTEWRLYVHYLIFFMAAPPFSSLSLFTPSITAGLGFSNLQAQLMTVPPYAAAYVVMIVAAVVADRYNMRGIVASASAMLGAIGYIASATLPPTAYNGRYGCLIIAACGTFACVAPLLGWLSSNIFSPGVAGIAIALNVSFGAPGQITGVWIYKVNEAKMGFPTGHWTNAGCLIALAVMSMGLMLYYRHLNSKILKQNYGRSRLYML